MDTFTVSVSGNGLPLNDAEVAVAYTDPAAGNTVAPETTVDGEASFLLPDAGGTYRYTISADDFVTKSVASGSKQVSVSLDSVGEAITGTVQDSLGAPLEAATVEAFQANNINLVYRATTAPDGTYTIHLPVGAPVNGYTVVAKKQTPAPGYVAVKQEDQAVGQVDFLDAEGSGLQPKTLIQEVEATVVGNRVKIDLAASPAFTDATQAAFALPDIADNEDITGSAGTAGGFCGRGRYRLFFGRGKFYAANQGGHEQRR